MYIHQIKGSNAIPVMNRNSVVEFSTCENNTLKVELDVAVP